MSVYSYTAPSIGLPFAGIRVVLSFWYAPFCPRARYTLNPALSISAAVSQVRVIVPPFFALPVKDINSYIGGSAKFGDKYIIAATVRLIVCAGSRG